MSNDFIDDNNHNKNNDNIIFNKTEKFNMCVAYGCLVLFTLVFGMIFIVALLRADCGDSSNCSKGGLARSGGCPSACCVGYSFWPCKACTDLTREDPK